MRVERTNKSFAGSSLAVCVPALGAAGGVRAHKTLGFEPSRYAFPSQPHNKKVPLFEGLGGSLTQLPLSAPLPLTQ